MQKRWFLVLVIVCFAVAMWHDGFRTAVVNGVKNFGVMAYTNTNSFMSSLPWYYTSLITIGSVAVLYLVYRMGKSRLPHIGIRKPKTTTVTEKQYQDQLSEPDLYVPQKKTQSSPSAPPKEEIVVEAE